jgi:hypothetical protein
MDTNAVEISEIIDLCTPNVDINEALVVRRSTSVSNGIIERFANLDHRLSILPLYPTCDS